MTGENPLPVSRGHCPNCDADRNAQIVAEDRVDQEDGVVWWVSTYSILRCLGCDTRYVRRAETFSEDTELAEDPVTGEDRWEVAERVTYWPSPTSRRRPPWLSVFDLSYPELSKLLEELYKALDNNMITLATIGIRTVFDSASTLLGAGSDQTFSDKLKELAAANKIGGEEKEILSTLTDAGSASAHRGWTPTPCEIEVLVRALENFLERAFALKHEIRQIKKNIPPRIAK